MQTLSVVEVEGGALVLAAPSGERFRLPVDAALLARLQQVPPVAPEKRLSPREIQALVRAGRSAEQVAAITGVPVASVERFVGPVLAERAYIVESALAVRLPPETEGARSRTFGAVMSDRLDALAAKDVRWSSAKEPSGWVLAVGFSADDLQHDARWRFDPKHMRLDADNVEASTLSQQGVPAALTPRLRAIEPTAPVTVVPQPAPAQRSQAPVTPRVVPSDADRSRFDSAAFHLPDLDGARRAAGGPGEASGPARRRARREPPAAAEGLPETRAMDVVGPDRTGDVFAPRPSDDRPGQVTPFPARPPADDTPAEDRPTEPLRRRRDRGRAGLTLASSRRPATEPQEERASGTAPSQTSAQADDAAGRQELTQEQDAAPVTRPRRGRTSMPSWDEIVFGRDDG